MRNGKEVRKNGSVITKHRSDYGYDVFYKVDGGFIKDPGSPWDYLWNARRSADTLLNIGSDSVAAPGNIVELVFRGRCEICESVIEVKGSELSTPQKGPQESWYRKEMCRVCGSIVMARPLT